MGRPDWVRESINPGFVILARTGRQCGVPTTTTMAAELAKVCRICRYADGVCTIGCRKTHERADPMCRLHGSTSRGTVPPARAKASARPAQEPPLGEQEGEEGHQPRTVGEELETAGHDQMTLFATRKRLHMQYPPDPLDKWIARDIQLSPGGVYVDNTAGETLSTEEREEYERYLERFHKRCKLGGKANRLVHIVDRYMPRIAEENRIFVMRFPDKVEKMLRRARGTHRKIRARRRQQQGERTSH